MFIVETSDLSKDAESSGAELSPSSTLGFGLVSQTSLHRFISEGDTDGVR